MKKTGSTGISVALITVVGICAICIFIACIINFITPLILQQKLQTIVNKYMYVIERYGYLTSSEKHTLLDELNKENLDISRITIEFPEFKKAYGERLEFSVSYRYTPIPVFGMKERNIRVYKMSYSKT